MVNRYATAAGKKYQNDVMKYLRDEKGLDAERLVLTGAEDEGDIILKLPLTFPTPGNRAFILEAKREKGFHLADWLDQADIESANYAKHRGLQRRPFFVVVHARRNYGLGKSYITTTLDEWLRQVI